MPKAFPTRRKWFSMDSNGHRSVLLRECVEGLKIKGNGIYADGTLGGGGHAKEIAARLTAGRLIGIDRDGEALRIASANLAGFTNVDIVRGNFSDIKNVLRGLGVSGLDGLLLDLGVSSFQIDEAGRGFSYMSDERLDMRMDSETSPSAYEVVNGYEAGRLAEIIFRYGEEKNARKIAKAIEERRKTKVILTTSELAETVRKALPTTGESHPEKRTFQAIRIHVNDELRSLETLLDSLPDIMNAGGRVCVVSFHSLEDRIIKNVFREYENPCVCPRDLPVCVCGKAPSFKVITKKPVLPGKDEIISNPRSKSAKLRIAEKINR